MSQVKPISPQEAVSHHLTSIPDFVIEAFNKCILENLKENRVGHIHSTFFQEEVEKEIKRLSGGELQLRWLDVESHYRAKGWTVTYDKPGYNESYRPSFDFSYVKN